MLTWRSIFSGREALRDACIKFLGLFTTFLHPEEGGYSFERTKIKQIRIIHLINSENNVKEDSSSKKSISDATSTAGTTGTAT